MSRIASNRAHPFERISENVAAAPFDNRTKAAVQRASAGRLDHIDLPAEQRISLEPPRRSVRQPDLAALQAANAPVGVVIEPVSASVRETGNMIESPLLLDRPQQSAECQLAFAANYEIDSGIRLDVGVGRKTRIVPADDEADARLQRANYLDQLESRLALKRHHRHTDYIGLLLVDQ